MHFVLIALMTNCHITINNVLRWLIDGKMVTWGTNKWNNEWGTCSESHMS